jgi:hypothetical protein
MLLEILMPRTISLWNLITFSFKLPVLFILLAPFSEGLVYFLKGEVVGTVYPS